jgi:outer membrane receptor for Fe3+-dicitrate
MSFTLPTHAQLEQYRTEAEHLIDGVTAVLDGIEKYGAWIPGLSAQLKSVQELDAVLKSARSFIEHIPDPL